jgi:hypothetical protein
MLWQNQQFNGGDGDTSHLNESEKSKCGSCISIADCGSVRLVMMLRNPFADTGSLLSRNVPRCNRNANKDVIESVRLLHISKSAPLQWVPNVGQETLEP